jgi:hypothetical protein
MLYAFFWVWSLCADVSEHSVPSSQAGRRVSTHAYLPVIIVVRRDVDITARAGYTDMRRLTTGVLL